MELRDYQKAAVDEIKRRFLSGEKKVLLHLDTGGGKTHCFSYILKQMSERGNRTLMAVRGRHLVDQASERLFHEHVPHGVLMSGHWNFRPSSLVQICSIDTLRARGNYPDAKLIIIDEAHHATSPSYRNFIDHYPDAFVLGVTATPYTLKPLSHIATSIVRPITMRQLIEGGYLVQARYFAPSIPDLKNVRTSSITKDYQTSDLEKLMDQSAVVGDVVSHWKRLGENRATLVFAVSVAHSKHLAEAFCAAGIPAEHCDADTPDSERKEINKRHASGQTKIICNVGIYCTGVDLPYVSCVVMTRSTKSLILYLQQAGRGTRIFPGKTDFLLLDHAGNIFKHGLIDQEREGNLDGKPKVERDQNIKFCKGCYAAFRGTRCPYCPGSVSEGISRDIIEIDGELKEVTELPLEVKIKNRVKELKSLAKLKGYKRGWAYYKCIDEFGKAVADEQFPRPAYTVGQRLFIRNLKTSLGQGVEESSGSGSDDSWPVDEFWNSRPGRHHWDSQE